MNTSTWHSLRKEIPKEIMNTDVLCEIIFSAKEQSQASLSLERTFTMMRDFENRYSRFKKDNLLWQLNQSETMTLSREFFDILASAQYFYQRTGGIFDPSILPALEQEGYASKPYASQSAREKSHSFSNLRLNMVTREAAKPKNLLLDLGGIGKGFIVDQAALALSLDFDNFLIDAGGDMYAYGANQKAGYPYWAIEVEHPAPDNDAIALLMLSNMAVATSGSNRRHWLKNKERKHHIIDPSLRGSARSHFLSVTVIAPSTVAADVLAKTLFILGEKKAPLFAEQFHIPALFVTADNKTMINRYAQPYVWTP